jgi:hypothetical protein
VPSSAQLLRIQAVCACVVRLRTRVRIAGRVYVCLCVCACGSMPESMFQVSSHDRVASIARSQTHWRWEDYDRLAIGVHFAWAWYPCAELRLQGDRVCCIHTVWWISNFSTAKWYVLQGGMNLRDVLERCAGDLYRRDPGARTYLFVRHACKPAAR